MALQDDPGITQMPMSGTTALKNAQGFTTG
jgi:hypothetical protein